MGRGLSVVVIGLGVRKANAEMVGFSVGLCRSDIGSSGEIRVFLFGVVLPLGGAIRPCDGVQETLGGGGSNGGGNFPERMPLSVPSVVLSSPAIRSTVCDGSVDLDLTSERNSRSSLERANESRGEEDDARGRENR
jgi:hypothetical protein